MVRETLRASEPNRGQSRGAWPEKFQAKRQHEMRTSPRWLRLRLAWLFFLFVCGVGHASAQDVFAGAESADSGHPSEFDHVLLAVVAILVMAKLGGHVFQSRGHPSVLGELCAGVLVGNLPLLGIYQLEFLREEHIVEFLGELGLVLLLFKVGLESDLRKLLSVGRSALLVASLGVFVPFLLGLLVSRTFLPEAHYLNHVFIGATLCATSVGITARVLGDIGALERVESTVILGAAVVDDILGLAILGVVTGAITSVGQPGDFNVLMVLLVIGKATLFLVGGTAVGLLMARRMFWIASQLHGKGLLVATSLLLCFGSAYLARVIGLEPIIGAFAAGLALDTTQYEDLKEREHHTIEELVDPIVSFLTPLFFVIVGTRIELTALINLETLAFAVVLTLAATVGKLICGLGYREEGNKWVVGFGMVPRGEVGLVFAGIGAGLLLQGQPVLPPRAYAAVVVMVAGTTLVGPVLLSRALGPPATPGNLQERE